MIELINSRAVVPGLVYRSAAPYRLDAAGVHEVVDALGLRAVADLRGQRERVLAPWNGLEAAGVELLDVSIDAGADESTLSLTTARELGELYLEWLDLKRETVARALSPLAEGTPTLFQCSAGKDRTGMLAALAGLLAGHDHERIIADYALTQEHMGEVKEAMLEAYRPLVPEAALAHLAQDNAPIILSAPEEAMAVFLNGIEYDYGGVVGFLNSTRMHPAKAFAIRENLERAAG